MTVPVQQIEYEVSFLYSEHVIRHSFTNKAMAQDFASKVEKGFGGSYITVTEIVTTKRIMETAS